MLQNATTDSDTSSRRRGRGLADMSFEMEDGDAHKKRMTSRMLSSNQAWKSFWFRIRSLNKYDIIVRILVLLTFLGSVFGTMYIMFWNGEFYFGTVKEQLPYRSAPINDFLVNRKVFSTSSNPFRSELEHLEGKSIALVLISHTREEYFRTSLESLLSVTGIEQVNLIVSMDFSPYYDILRSVVDEFKEKLTEKFGDSRTPLFLENEVYLGNYVNNAKGRIARHYGKVLRQVFDRMEFDYAILSETDLIFSPDFLEYMFTGANELQRRDDLQSNSTNSFTGMKKQPEILSISAWSDHGFSEFDLNESRAILSSYFAGLAYIMKGSTWRKHLRPYWPISLRNVNYDNYLRYESPAGIGYLNNIIPSVSRTHHIAHYGVHFNNEGFELYDNMVLASGNTTVSEAEFALVADESLFEERIRNEARMGYNSTLVIVGIDTFLKSHQPKLHTQESIIILVNDSDQAEMQTTFRTFGLYPDEDILRSTHKGLYSFRLKKYACQITIVSTRFAPYWGIDEY